MEQYETQCRMKQLNEFSSLSEAYNYYYNIVKDKKVVNEWLRGGDYEIVFVPSHKENNIDKPFKKYKNEVWRLTKMVDLSLLKNSELRGFRSYHLDHKYSIFDGFKNNVPEYLIADIGNLRFIPHKENTEKGTKSIIDKNNLIISNR